MPSDCPPLPPSRRRFLALSGLAALTPLLGPTFDHRDQLGHRDPDPLGRPVPGRPAPGRRLPLSSGDPVEAYQREFVRMITERTDIRLMDGPAGFLYRPRQLLVAPADLGRVLDVLPRLAKSRFTVGESFADVARVVFDEETDIPAVVAGLRNPDRWRGDPVPAVQPHHVTVGHPNIMGNPGGPPTLSAKIDPPVPGSERLGRGVLVGICDTGLWLDAPNFHQDWLNKGCRSKAGDEDQLYRQDGKLAMEGGHGTFVAGVLRQTAPGVEFDPQVALDPTGIGDEELLARALAGLDPQTQLVNLSLGCLTQDDLPPLPMANMLMALQKRRTGELVVLASAGNAASRRPNWPAAFSEVIAVAAVQDRKGAVGPAPYSNFGSWVDACAVGEWTSTFVPGVFDLPGCDPVVFEGFASWVGTSFAAPVVAAQVARTMVELGVSAREAVATLLDGPTLAPGFGVYVAR